MKYLVILLIGILITNCSDNNNEDILLDKCNDGTLVKELTEDIPAVYPNPSDTELFITNSTANNTRLTTDSETNNSLEDLGPITLELYDFVGNRIINQKFNKRDGSPKLDVSHLKKGIYILKIKAKEVDETHQVIIK
ncbi:T9SS type A sorting domain-containing protein [Gelatiniphilus marinus]|uniref:T9SS type A sorting domain-containing protein n=1 Tax=Gelatiniphilus marinus TaxID=1759464 RepID=A0ABW5JPY3_9FLAO